jgi:hypothetical protein
MKKSGNFGESCNAEIDRLSCELDAKVREAEWYRTWIIGLCSDAWWRVCRVLTDRDRESRDFG